MPRRRPISTECVHDASTGTPRDVARQTQPAVGVLSGAMWISTIATAACAPAQCPPGGAIGRSSAEGEPMKVRWLFAVAAAGALFATLASTAHAAPPIVIRFSHVVAVDTPKGQRRGALQEARRGAHLGQGAGRRPPQREPLQGQGGARGAPARCGRDAGAVALQVRSAGRDGVRGVRPSVHLRRRRQAPEGDRGPVGKRLLARLEPKGIHGLAYWDNGFKSFSANRPLHGPADFRGLRMRVQSSMVLEAQMRALGAVPWSWPSPTSTRRCAPGWSTGPRTPSRTSTRSACTRRRGTSR